MLFFVYGSESYLVREKCRQIETRLRQDKGSLSCEHLDSCDLQQLQSKAASLSMFGEHLCLRLDGVIKSGKIDGDAGIQFLESIGTTVSIIFIEAEPDRRGKLVKYLMKHAEVHACQPLEGEELNAWIMRTAEDRGGAFDRTAAGLLAQTAGSDLWKLSQEIDKLLAYTGGQAITAEAIQAITIPVCEEDIFPFIDAIAEGKNARAVQLLHQNLQAGMHALALFRMIVRQFRLLIYARA
ncbi:MAG TPA: DNA polymerase III subunit delta, partial [bacterium]|nr:DNA polymerase III subunit delta [bacterium]